MNNVKLEQWLEESDACSDAANWLYELDPLTFADAWDKCPHDEWKLWAADWFDVMPSCTCEGIECDGDCDYADVKDNPDALRGEVIAAFDKWEYKAKPKYNRNVVLEVTVSLRDDNTATPADVALAVHDLLAMYSHQELSGVTFAVRHVDYEVE